MGTLRGFQAPAVAGHALDRANFTGLPYYVTGCKVGAKWLISLVFGSIGTDFCKKIRVLQHFPKSTRFSSWNLKKLANLQHVQKFAEFSQKLLIFQTDFLLKFWDCNGAKVCKSCRAWKMLSNAYFLAKFRFDTAENEPAKNLQKFANFPNFATPNPCWYQRPTTPPGSCHRVSIKHTLRVCDRERSPEYFSTNLFKTF